MTEEYEQLKKICEQRKSVRSFSDEPVLASDVEMIKEIAFTSPYASGRKNWDILVIDDKEVMNNIATAVKEYVREKADDMRDDSVDSFLNYSKNFTFFTKAPLILVPIFRISKGVSHMIDGADEKIMMWERDSYTKSISCVAMLILLAAQSLDLCACYMTGPLIAESEIKKIINMKKGYSIGAIIPVGHKKNVST